MNSTGDLRRAIMNYSVRVAKPSEIQHMQESWDKLVLSMQLPSIFSTWEWMTLWWKHFGQAYQPLVLLISNDNELVGILPLALRTMIIEDGVMPARTLSLWGSIELHSDHLDIISARDVAEPCMEAIFRYLRNDFRGWDVLYLSHVSEESCFLQYIRDGGIALDSGIENVSVSPYIAIAVDHDFEIDNYLKSLGKNKRHDIKRRSRNLYGKDMVTYTISNPDINTEDIEVLFNLHESRVIAKGLETTFSGRALMEFHTEVARLMAQKGWLRLRFLKNGDAPLAAIYCFSFANRWFAYQSGLDPNWDAKGVGAVLLYSAIKEAFHEHVDEFDFLRGGEVYKDKWTSRHRDLWDVRIYNSTIVGALFKGSYKARSIFKRMIRNEL